MNLNHLTVEQTLLNLGKGLTRHLGLPSLKAQDLSGKILLLNHVLPRLNTKQFLARQTFDCLQGDLRQLLANARLEGLKPVRLDSFLRSQLSERNNSSEFSIVFSGAYWDIIDFALPVFRASQCPLTLLLSLEEIECNATPWWCVAQELCQSKVNLALTTDEGVNYFHLTDRNSREEAMKDFLNRWREGRFYDRAGLLEMCNLFGSVYQQAVGRQTCLPAGEIIRLADDPLIQFGINPAHTLLSGTGALHIKCERIRHQQSILENYVNQPLSCIDFSVFSERDKTIRDECQTYLERSGFRLPILSSSDRINPIRLLGEAHLMLMSEL